jgi:hypothetical protein
LGCLVPVSSLPTRSALGAPPEADKLKKATVKRRWELDIFTKEKIKNYCFLKKKFFSQLVVVFFVPVAQLDRATVCGTVGRVFESRRER